VKGENVVSLAEVKKLKSQERTQDEYISYLKLLRDDELQFEIDDYFDKFDSQPFTRELAHKGRLILEEIASRINSSPMKADSIIGMRDALVGKLV
jgi:hypothetical protein